LVCPDCFDRGAIHSGGGLRFTVLAAGAAGLADPVN